MRAVEVKSVVRMRKSGSKKKKKNMEERIRQQLGDKQPQEVSTVVGMYLGVQ